jgi:hypothetical protein
MLLFDNNEIALSDIYHSLYFKTGTQKLKMPCAVNASWEADVIILSGFVLMIPKWFKDHKSSNSKTIIIMENDDEFTKSINYQLSFDLIFPHSKIVEVININADDSLEKEFLLEGHDANALDMVSHILKESVSIRTFHKLINRILNKTK